eukprot:2517139-Amphidinium_carterae.1
MSAANQVVECGGKTILLDKSSFCGGNSTKAASSYFHDHLNQSLERYSERMSICVIEALVAHNIGAILSIAVNMHGNGHKDWFESHHGQKTPY